MKHLSLFFLILLAVACKDDNSKDSNQIKVVNTATAGTWRITYYFDTDTDETAKFSGYNFTFTNGTVTATNGTNTYTGTWSITDSNSNDDTMDDLHFNLAFTSPANFADLTDDWEILEITDTKMRLTDVSGGNGGTDFLTFEKN
jgi:hypothetical protein